MKMWEMLSSMLCSGRLSPWVVHEGQVCSAEAGLIGPLLGEHGRRTESAKGPLPPPSQGSSGGLMELCNPAQPVLLCQSTFNPHAGKQLPLAQLKLCSEP